MSRRWIQGAHKVVSNASEAAIERDTLKPERKVASPGAQLRLMSRCCCFKEKNRNARSKLLLFARRDVMVLVQTILYVGIPTVRR